MSELQKTRCTVNLYVNGRLLMSRFFKGRNARSKWMRDISEDFLSVPHFFELKYCYFQRSEKRGAYLKTRDQNKKAERKAHKVISMKEETIQERRKRFTVYSNKSPMGVASNGE